MAASDVIRVRKDLSFILALLSYLPPILLIHLQQEHLILAPIILAPLSPHRREDAQPEVDGIGRASTSAAAGPSSSDTAAAHTAPYALTKPSACSTQAAAPPAKAQKLESTALPTQPSTSSAKATREGQQKGGGTGTVTLPVLPPYLLQENDAPPLRPIDEPPLQPSHFPFKKASSGSIQEAEPSGWDVEDKEAGEKSNGGGSSKAGKGGRKTAQKKDSGDAGKAAGAAAAAEQQQSTASTAPSAQEAGPGAAGASSSAGGDKGAKRTPPSQGLFGAAMRDIKRR